MIYFLTFKLLNAKMNKIYASNNSDLVEMLSAIDISVPLRSERRTTKHCEQWSICRWLSTIPNLEFPLTVKHQDKPDFYLKAGKDEYGIECTEAIPQDYAHATAISEKNSDDTVIDMSLFGWGRKMKPKEIHEIANRTKLSGPGWEGDTPEFDWVFAMSEVTKIKTSLLQKQDFKKYSNNCLLIYDNLPRPTIDFSKACSFLRIKLESYWNGDLIFDTIFVQTDDLLMKFSFFGVEKFKTINLW